MVNIPSETPLMKTIFFFSKWMSIADTVLVKAGNEYVSIVL